MRKITQSMYQSNLKVPVTTSKVFDGSQLFKSSGNIHQEGRPSTANKSSYHQPVRKVEGQDLGRSQKFPKKNFEQTVNNLKQKPTQKVLEQQYIGGLQEQIKYLQYELKLLKDKQIIQRQGVNQLDNFLKDEIPINENILAMKNKYNSTKANLEGMHKQINRKIQQAQEVLGMQKKEIQNYMKCINAHRKQAADRKQEFKGKLADLIKQLSLTKDEIDYLAKQNKRKLQEMKGLTEAISAIQRQNQKERIEEVRTNQQKQKKKQKFDENFKVIKDELVQYLQKHQELQAHEDKNPLLQPIDQQNSTLRKKIMLNQKQKSTAQNIINEINLILDEDKKQRQIERQQKYKLTSQSQVYRNQIQYLQRYIQNLIKDQTNRFKNKWLKQMSISLKQKQDNYDLLKTRLQNLQAQCTSLIQERKQLSDAIQNEKTTSKLFDSQIQQLKNGIVTARSECEALNRVTEQIKQDTPPTKNELQKCKGRIPMLQKDIEKKLISIEHLNKQVDLLKQLKALDLEQLQMISQGGSKMQNTLHSFIKNWQKIKSK